MACTSDINHGSLDQSLASKASLRCAGKLAAKVEKSFRTAGPDVGRGLQKRIDSPSAQIWVVPSAKHNSAREVGPAEYDRRLSEFFNATLITAPA